MHALAQILEHYPARAEVPAFAGLDYTVEKRPLFTFDNENNAAVGEVEIKIAEREVQNHFATIRTDTEQFLV